jgi:RNA 2',3'-cyclic 3'-phosphodiesterase
VRLFVAVWPSEEVLASIAAFARPEVDGLRWTTRDQWHVTLRFLGSCDLDDAVEAFSRLDAPPGEAVLGPATGRFGKRILHVPVAGLDEVARAAVAATGEVGEPPEDRAFKGHLTLARSRRGDTDLRPLAGQPLSGRWPVREVTLVASHLNPKGARYEVVWTVPLA